ncbi:MAG: 16S rRNA (uracil(1498)-N(3))-methyltransferase [Candidatus Omnitrophica bacterium]|nr:16S rRNA (uracil(1498)-N(3))-methyltransferase [Candidatus Omnitrophota bacterium]
MSRFYVPPEKVDRELERIVLDAEEAHHAIDVMRLKEGDAITVFDGKGNEYRCSIERVRKAPASLLMSILDQKTIPAVNGLTLHLLQAIPKKDKIELIIEKAVEIGVDSVTAVVTERTVSRPDKTAVPKKLARWRKIALEAAKQSGRADVPAVFFAQNLERAKEIIPDYDLILCAHLNEGTSPLKTALKGFSGGKVLLMIGPEGDFTPREIDSLKAKNVKFVSLGRNVLKSDTAALYLLSVVKYELT